MKLFWDKYLSFKWREVKLDRQTENLRIVVPVERKVLCDIRSVRPMCVSWFSSHASLLRSWIQHKSPAGENSNRMVFVYFGEPSCITAHGDKSVKIKSIRSLTKPCLQAWKNLYLDHRYVLPHVWCLIWWVLQLMLRDVRCFQGLYCTSE